MHTSIALALPWYKFLMTALVIFLNIFWLRSKGMALIIYTVLLIWILAILNGKVLFATQRWWVSNWPWVLIIALSTVSIQILAVYLRFGAFTMIRINFNISFILFLVNFMPISLCSLIIFAIWECELHWIILLIRILIIIILKNWTSHWNTLIGIVISVVLWDAWSLFRNWLKTMRYIGVLLQLCSCILQSFILFVDSISKISNLLMFFYFLKYFFYIF